MLGQSVIAAPSISENHRARSDHVADERGQALSRRIRDMAHPHTAKAFGLSDLDSDDQEMLVAAATTFPSVFHTPYQRLVDLHVAV